MYTFKRYDPSLPRNVCSFKGNQKLIFEGYRYNIHHIVPLKGVKTWRCVCAKKLNGTRTWCKGRAETWDNDKNGMSKGEHNHPPEHEIAELEYFKSQLIVAAIECPQANLTELINEAASLMMTGGSNFGNRESLKKLSRKVTEAVSNNAGNNKNLIKNNLNEIEIKHQQKENCGERFLEENVKNNCKEFGTQTDELTNYLTEEEDNKNNGANLILVCCCEDKQKSLNTSYFVCNENGNLEKHDCPDEKIFNINILGCEEGGRNDHGEFQSEDEENVLKEPQFQAPDDICSGAIPLTKLGAPVMCNPSISSCPDGFLCTLHQRTGTSYCCQASIESIGPEGSAGNIPLCSGLQVTFFETFSGLPKTCSLTSPSGCPTGFGCNLVDGAFTRCCGRDFGCPANSAGFVHPTTGSHVQCNSADSLSCPNGFICTQSSMFNTGICCSDTSNAPIDVCGGESPLPRPNPCSASDPCPMGYSCRNGRCCPSKGVCPVGAPLGGVTSCSANGNPCPNNFQCVTNNGHQYCCPSPEHVCSLPNDSGIQCPARVLSPISRFYFDSTTGSCRTFQFSQCGGNANNFDSLEQCEGFCLESQCPDGGTGLRAGPSLARCSPGEQNGARLADTCPAHYVCVQPLFGQHNFVCCSSPEQVCREPVAAGVPCFGPFLTIQRFHFNQNKGQCEAFQYYGCGGTGNNFITRSQCEMQCVPSVQNSCNGVAPLNDPGDYVQRCNDNSQCPSGSWCNQKSYCCPHGETACSSQKSIGHTCLSQRPGTFWYYDSDTDSCLPFEYSGCGGTPNRFSEREACEYMCLNKQENLNNDGGDECPRGMAPLLASGGRGGGRNNKIRSCRQPLNNLNGAGSSLSSYKKCPEGSSCVQSINNKNSQKWICCISVAQCPNGRNAYLIPNSDSIVACVPEALMGEGGEEEENFNKNCPSKYSCMQSANVPGFYMCCSSNNYNSVGGAGRNTDLPSLGLLSNGAKCVVNQIQACPLGYLCIGDNNIASGGKGVCCKAQPKCTRKGRKPVYIAPKQVLTCGDEEAGCPEGSRCSRSTLSGIHICCMPRESSAAVGYTRGSNGALPFFALGSRVPQQCTADRDDECPEEFECEMGTDEQFVIFIFFLLILGRWEKGMEYLSHGYSFGTECMSLYCCPAWDRCPAGASPFFVEGSRKPLGCNWMANNCPEGYTCEGSKDRAICCRMRANKLQCPNGRSPYLYGKRPVVCHSTSNKRICPTGFECTPSQNGGGQRLCCSTPENHAPECVAGFGYLDPSTGRNQICDPTLETCPLGYRCKRSTLANTHVCCSLPLDNRYDGYCPPGQIPLINSGQQQNLGGLDDFIIPTNCHQVLNPCPSNNLIGPPYQCIYSTEKQDSFCCASAAHNHQRFGNYFGNNNNIAAFPSRVSSTIQGCGGGDGLENNDSLMAQQIAAANQMLQLQQQQQNAGGIGGDGRNAHCCTTVPLDNRIVFKANTAAILADEQQHYPQFNSQYSTQYSTQNNGTLNVSTDVINNGGNSIGKCPSNMINIGGLCKRMFFIGQPGCETDQQCTARSNGTVCTRGYCACPPPLLIHESRCVLQCPEAMLTIAGRCYDLGSIVFMDSVDNRENGTIGGFCLASVVPEEQCNVKNAYCSEKSLTCQCTPGYELRIDDINNRTEKVG
uniref:BPTI/Kunitz inhibitor domain-containing protein n=1 Tax=Meloidogyne javanica TaxID=6303 RepID=A0A915LIZ3_MELJA